jgi:hypothetical protein
MSLALDKRMLAEDKVAQQSAWFFNGVSGKWERIPPAPPVYKFDPFEPSIFGARRRALRVAKNSSGKFSCGRVYEPLALSRFAGLESA